MTELRYLIGDATAPDVPGPKIIAHVCNDRGYWGKGFVLALSEKWRQPEADFREWAKSGTNFELGEIQLVQVEDQLWVANIVGQHDVHAKQGVQPVRYEAISKALKKLADAAASREASVHMPRIGCGLAGGEWSSIEPMIQDALVRCGVDVYVYDLC